MTAIKTLIIDNYDSFTYNIFHMVAALNGLEPDLIKNNKLEVRSLSDSKYDNIIISPGPGHPDDAQDFGVCRDILAMVDIPILGICLGHQGVASCFGGRVVRAAQPVHGQLAQIHHHGEGLFQHIPATFSAVRYHSLLVDPDLPSVLEPIAWTDDGVIMAIRHCARSLYGVQFHPEAICSTHGRQLLANFRDLSMGRQCLPTTSQAKTIVATPSLVQQKKPKTTYTLKHKRFDCNKPVANIYDAIHANDKRALWLDGEGDQTPAACSIIALSSGPLSFQIKYHVNDRTIEIVKQNQKEIRSDQTIFDYLDDCLSNTTIEKNHFPHAFQCGFVGYFGYELKQDTLPVRNQHRSSLPDAQWLFCDRAILFDHQQQQCYLLALDIDNRLTESIDTWFTEMSCVIGSLDDAVLKPTEDTSSTVSDDVTLEMHQNDYLKAIHKSLAHIRDGDSYEVCLTNRLRCDGEIDALRYYQRLRMMNPAPYAAFLSFGDCQVACTSVERFLKISVDGWAEAKPIKGTMPRGSNAATDQANIETLREDRKFQSENMMIVDLLRNDLGQVCEVGSVSVPKLMEVESYATLHQLVSTVTGKIKQSHSVMDCVKACFPGGSMTGAPKIRTVEIIDSLERSARGIYSGCIGYVSLSGAADFNIVIRSAVITPEQLMIGVGGAIIALSDPTEEYHEMLLKGQVLRQALGAINALEKPS